jgi:hypothetical protein
VSDEVLVVADYNTVTTPLTLTSLSPATAVPWRSSGFTLTLNGTGFTPSSVVSVNGAFPTVNFISSTQLSVPVTTAQIATPGAFQVWVENFPSGATCAAFAALPFTVDNDPIVVSRMTHGSITPPFDINLPFTGTRGVECRSSASLGAGNYMLVYTFANTLTSVASATVTGHDPTTGTGTVSGSPVVGPNVGLGLTANQCAVNLTNVSNAQYITVTLNSVHDVAGNIGDVLSPQMGVLLGDTTGDGFVNSADISQTKSQSGQSVGGSNFREDLNTDGFLNSGDISLVKSKSGTALPSMP